MTDLALVIEDEKEIRELIRYNLEREGAFTAQIALTGEDGLSAALTKPPKRESGNKAPDLIILDLLLDQMKGEDFLKQLKSNPQYVSIPIIIASSFSPRSYKKIFEVDPNLTFLEKPFDQEKLLAGIEAKLGAE